MKKKMNWDEITPLDLLKIFVYLYSRDRLYAELNPLMRARQIHYAPILISYLRRGLN